MATIYFTGFERGSTGGTLYLAGTYTVVSATKRTGAYALRCNPTGTNTTSVAFGKLDTYGDAVECSSGDADVGTVVFYFRIATGVGTADEWEVIAGGFNASGQFPKILLHYDGHVGLASGSYDNVFDTGGTALSLNTWYRAELRWNVANGATSYLNIYEETGTTAIQTVQQTNATLQQEPVRFTLGKYLDNNGNSLDIYYDDFHWWDSNTATIPHGGYGFAVKVAKPTGTGAVWEWSGAYTDVDEIPPNTTDYAYETSSDQEGRFDMEDASTVGINGAILAVKHSSYVLRHTTGTDPCQLKTYSGSTGQADSLKATSSSADTREQLFDTDPDTSAAWTASAWDAVEFGVVTGTVSGGGVRNASTLAEVGYYPLLKLVTGSGGIAFAGAATTIKPLLNKEVTGSGGITFSGTASISRERAYDNTPKLTAITTNGDDTTWASSKQLTVPHPTGNNRALLVGVVCNNDANELTSVTYDYGNPTAVSLVKIGSIHNGTYGGSVELWINNETELENVVGTTLRLVAGSTRYWAVFAAALRDVAHYPEVGYADFGSDLATSDFIGIYDLVYGRKIAFARLPNGARGEEETAYGVDLGQLDFGTGAGAESGRALGQFMAFPEGQTDPEWQLDASWPWVAAAATLQPVFSGIELQGYAGVVKEKSVIGSGGIVYSGTAGTLKEKSVDGSGGTTFSGAATTLFEGTTVKVYDGTGGIVFAGAADTTTLVIKTYAASGGIVFSGSATTNKLVVRTYVASGGITFSGAAGLLKEKVSTGAGSIVYSGAATKVRDRVYAASGGITYSGTGATIKEKAPTGTGTITFAGSATTTKLVIKTYTASGGITLSGTASVATEKVPAPSGSIIFSGAAACSFTGVSTKTYSGTGGIVFAGDAEAVKEKSYVCSGGVTFANAAGLVKEKVFAGSGEFTISGAAGPAREKVPTPSGSLLFSGESLLNKLKVFAAIGGIVISGTAGYSFDKAPVGTGGITYSGSAAVAKELTPTVSGGIAFSGAASCSFTGVGLWEWAGQGTVAFSGDATYLKEKEYSPSGGITFDGAASTSYTAGSNSWEYGSSGGIVFSGQADAQTIIARRGTWGLIELNVLTEILLEEYVGSGGIVFSGAAEVSKEKIPVPSGEITLAGSAVTSKDKLYLSSGGIIFSGSAVATHEAVYTYVASGGITFAGEAVTAKEIYPTSSGGIVFGGVAAVAFNAEYSWSGIGGVVFAGAAQLVVEKVVTGSEGVVFGGAAEIIWAPTILDKQYGGSGGIIFSGAADIYKEKAYPASGQVAFSGAAATNYQTLREFVGSGGVVFGGAATTSQLIARRGTWGLIELQVLAEEEADVWLWTGQGGITLSGSASLVVEKDATAAGGIVFSGSASVSREIIPVVSGGIVFSGSATTTFQGVGIWTYSGTGGISLGGSASSEKTKVPSVSGGVVFSGAAATQKLVVWTYTGSGSIVFSGSAATSFTSIRAYVGSGGIVFAGQAATEYTSGQQAHIYSGSGGILFSGSAGFMWVGDKWPAQPPVEIIKFFEIWDVSDFCRVWGVYPEIGVRNVGGGVALAAFAPEVGVLDSSHCIKVEDVSNNVRVQWPIL